MNLTRSATSLHRHIKQVSQEMVGEERSGPENDLSRPECKCSRRASLLRLQRCNQCMRPIIAGQSFAESLIEASYEAVLIVSPSRETRVKSCSNTVSEEPE